MPTPRQHGGAQLVPINLNSPAFKGLNTEESGSILGPEWANALNNAVFDASGRPASRNGWNSNTSTAFGGEIQQVFEYVQADGTTELIFSTDSDLLRNPTAPASIDGSLTITDGNIKFVNFNNNCVAFGIGTAGIPAVYTGAGNFADITVSTGTAPTGTIGTAAFGRLWGVDADLSTIRYSALLDHTEWDTADGGGVIDMLNVWPRGTDQIVAITEYGGNLIVFGQDTTVIWSDGQSHELGIDPTTLYVADTIPGVGAVSQFAMTETSGDFWFLSRSGVVGLRREVVQKSTPTTNISKNIQSQLLTFLNAESNQDDITMTYSPEEDFVLLIFPGTRRTACFDTRQLLEDGAARVTTWTTSLRTCTYVTADQSLQGSLVGTNGEIVEYSGHDDADATYSFQYESGWLDLGEDAAMYLKFVKRLTSLVFVEASTNITHTIEYDFGEKSFSDTRAVAGGGGSEFNVAEFGTNGSKDPNDPNFTAGTDVAQFSGGIVLRTMRIPGHGSGQYIKVGISVDTDNASFALQQINLYAKIGRMAA